MFTEKIILFLQKEETAKFTELFKKIEESAKKNVRSVNKEIQFLLASAVGKK